MTQETFNYLNSPKTFEVIETIMKNLLIDLILVVPLAYCMEYFGKKVLFMESFLENSKREIQSLFHVDDVTLIPVSDRESSKN